MKFSMVDGERREAEKGLSGLCIGCGKQMIAKCGEVKVKHWAHRTTCECDHWWENETDWHRDWKNQFPVEFQEVRHKDEKGEWHIADVKTSLSWVLEFQNSPICPKERDSRNTFYRTIVWIVNGTRLKRDKKQFLSALESGVRVSDQLNAIKVFSSDSPIVERWAGCRAPVFFDFGADTPLWCLYPTDSPNWCFVAPLPRESLIAQHQGGELQLRSFLEFMQTFGRVSASYAHEALRIQQLNLRRQNLTTPLTGFHRYLARQRSRRRF